MAQSETEDDIPPVVIRPTNDTSWPHPRRVAYLEWRMRYGEEGFVSASDRLAIASALSAYLHLVEVPSASRYLPMIRRRLREEEADPPLRARHPPESEGESDDEG